MKYSTVGKYQVLLKFLQYKSVRASRGTQDLLKYSAVQIRRMERLSCIKTGTPIFDLQVSATRCARAALADQAHGTPLVHKK